MDFCDVEIERLNDCGERLDQWVVQDGETSSEKDKNQNKKGREFTEEMILHSIPFEDRRELLDRGIYSVISFSVRSVLSDLDLGLCTFEDEEIPIHICVLEYNVINDRFYHRLDTYIKPASIVSSWTSKWGSTDEKEFRRKGSSSLNAVRTELIQISEASDRVVGYDVRAGMSSMCVRLELNKIRSLKDLPKVDNPKSHSVKFKGLFKHFFGQEPLNEAKIVNAASLMIYLKSFRRMERIYTEPEMAHLKVQYSYPTIYEIFCKLKDNKDFIQSLQGQSSRSKKLKIRCRAQSLVEKIDADEFLKIFPRQDLHQLRRSRRLKESLNTRADHLISNPQAAVFQAFESGLMESLIDVERGDDAALLTGKMKDLGKQFGAKMKRELMTTLGITQNEIQESENENEVDTEDLTGHEMAHTALLREERKLVESEDGGSISQLTKDGSVVSEISPEGRGACDNQVRLHLNVDNLVMPNYISDGLEYFKATRTGKRPPSPPLEEMLDDYGPAHIWEEVKVGTKFWRRQRRHVPEAETEGDHMLDNFIFGRGRREKKEFEEEKRERENGKFKVENDDSHEVLKFDLSKGVWDVVQKAGNPLLSVPSEFMSEVFEHLAKNFPSELSIMIFEDNAQQYQKLIPMYIKLLDFRKLNEAAGAAWVLDGAKYLKYLTSCNEVITENLARLLLATGLVFENPHMQMMEPIKTIIRKEPWGKSNQIEYLKGECNMKMAYQSVRRLLLKRSFDLSQSIQDSMKGKVYSGEPQSENTDRNVGEIKGGGGGGGEKGVKGQKGRKSYKAMSKKRREREIKIKINNRKGKRGGTVDFHSFLGLGMIEEEEKEREREEERDGERRDEKQSAFHLSAVKILDKMQS